MAGIEARSASTASECAIHYCNASWRIQLQSTLLEHGGESRVALGHRVAEHPEHLLLVLPTLLSPPLQGEVLLPDTLLLPPGPTKT